MPHGGEKAEQLLVGQLARNDKRAWAQFLAAHRDEVFGVCFRMLGNPDEATEATQEVFLRAVKGIRRFRGESLLGTWLHQIACNLCLDRLEASGRRAKCIAEKGCMDGIACEDPRSDRLPASIGLHKAFRRALAELAPVFREVILLREIEHRSYQEIATKLGVPINTVKTRIYRARAKLRQRLAGFR
jgi:RNA polymerase sigma-70 factor (ECF subfamily)